MTLKATHTQKREREMGREQILTLKGIERDMLSYQIHIYVLLH